MSKLNRAKTRPRDRGAHWVLSPILLVGLWACIGCRHENPPATPTTAPSATAAFTSPSGRQFAIARLDDSNPPEHIVEPPTVAGAAPSPDLFKGTDRKAAKISLSSAPVESFTDLADFLDSLPPDSQMTHHNPAITEDSTSNRVDEENRNVRVTVWLYAAKKETDNDFHLIMGREPGKTPRFMTMELSGLPPSGDPFRAKLKQPRDDFKTFFGSNLPTPKYDKYDPPIPVEVTGSIFFDVDHPAGAVGPTGFKPTTAWEVHPLSAIKFEP